MDVFSANRNGLGRRLRAGLLAAALVAGVGAPLVAAATPAHAEGGGTWDDNGQGGGKGTTQPGGGTGVGADNFYCKGIEIWNKKPPVKAYDGPYMNCNGYAGYKRTGAITQCPVGFQVFRFYGTYKEPSSAYTVSDVQLKSWCSPESLYTFWGVNPADYTGKTPNSPWFSRIADNPFGKTIGGGHFSTVGVTEFNRLTAGVPYSKSGSCATAQTTPNPIAAYLSDPAVTAASKTSTRNLFWQAYLVLSKQGAYPKTANAMLGLSSIKRSAAGIVSMTFDTKPCSSPMDYISTADTAKLSQSSEKAKFKVTGTCYIPLDRMRYEFKNGSRTQYAYPSLQGVFQQGLRYSPYYGTSTFTSASPRGAAGKAPTTSETATLKSWRATMGAWYAKQPIYKGKDQVTPVDPFKLKSNGSPSGIAQGANLAKAKSTLVNNSRCRFGSQVNFSSVATGSAPTASLDLKMDNKELFQSGGMNRVQEVTVSSNGIQCLGAASTCADANVKVTKLAYNVAVTSTDPTNYTECKGSTTAGCDYKILSVTARKGPIQPDTTIRIAFFNPTLSAQKMKFTISSITGQYQYQGKVGGINMTLESPLDGTQVGINTAGGTQGFLKPLTVGAVGSPMVLTRSGTSYSYTAPVIGAVDHVLD